MSQACSDGGGASPQQLNIRKRKTSKIVFTEEVSERRALCQQDFEPESLPGATHPSPVRSQSDCSDFLSDKPVYIMHDPQVASLGEGGCPSSPSTFRMRVAQAYQTLHFNPAETVVGIVTCGGLCPGLNDVIRGVTYMCSRTYKAKRIIGFRYGFWGLSAAGRDRAVELDTNKVSTIHRRGGTSLGTSRGPQKPDEMVDTLVQYGVNILFCIGGDGTQRGAAKIGAAARRRGLDIAVVGIPKTIDNDLSFSHRTFGFETAVEHAVTAIRAAHAEASSHPYGIGVVKVMGRHSGFIAAQATIASQMVNICLIPEQPVSKEVVMRLIDARLKERSFCVLCIAEGFGQDWSASDDNGRDASGNKKLADIGPVSKDAIAAWMKAHPVYHRGTIKLIDPSYMIRACPANTSDSAFCVRLATLAVHEAFRGTTNSIVANWYNNFIVVPVELATSLRKVVLLNGELWRQVREITVHLSTTMENNRRERLERSVQSLEFELQKRKRELSKL